MKPTKQIVYLPVNGEQDKVVCNDYPDWMDRITGVLEQEGYFFTPEQLNTYTQNVIKQTLKTAAEKAKINYKEDDEVIKVKSKKLDIDYLSEASSKVSFNINKDSITNTFEETFKQFEV
jgi:hypothetical protein